MVRKTITGPPKKVYSCKAIRLGLVEDLFDIALFGHIGHRQPQLDISLHLLD
jgi:hypothetical protein